MRRRRSISDKNEQNSFFPVHYCCPTLLYRRFQKLSHSNTLYQANRKIQLEDWTLQVKENLEGLSLPQARVLALFALGIAVKESCSLSKLSHFRGAEFKQDANTIKRRFREFYQEKERKRGENRKELETSLFFKPLLKWVLSLWHTDQVALAMDAVNLKDRFIVLAICVVWGNCAIPVTWKILPANEKGAWKEHWLDLLKLIAPAIPKTMKTIVCADRGLYAPWLFDVIVSYGWHPFLRVSVTCTFDHGKGKNFQKMIDLSEKNKAISYVGTATQTRKIACSLLTCWKPNCEKPWLVLTDLPIEEANVLWYRYRSWIERCFKVIKSAGWDWEESHIKDCARMERFWLVIVLATMAVLSLGAPAEESSFNCRILIAGD